MKRDEPVESIDTVIISANLAYKITISFIGIFQIAIILIEESETNLSETPQSRWMKGIGSFLNRVDSARLAHYTEPFIPFSPFH